MSWIRKFSRDRMLFASMMVLSLSALVVLGALLTNGVAAARAQQTAPDATPLTIPPPKTLTNEFTRIAQQLEPSVVFISTESKPIQTTRRRTPQQPRQQAPDDMFAPFERFFGMPFGEQMPPRRREGTGSGFIVDKNGYILTNLHVVDEAERIKVRLTGEKTEYNARLIGSDPETDVAVIKIDPGKPLQPVKIANSDGVQVGDWAVAIGAPFGLETSVTAGIVSATGRDIAQQFQRFIQTDAAINPGNSGGPLVNINGEVIGINTMIATSSGGYQGIGFALPMNMAVKVYNDVISTGRVARGSIGIEFPKDPKPETLKALGFDSGVIVMRVEPGGPADKAGLQSDDILMALNGKPIKDGDDLVSRVSEMPSGTEISITLDREGEKMTKKVTIRDRMEVFPDRFARRRPEMTDPGDASPTSARFGIGVRALSAAERKEMELTAQGGVIVTAVEEGSFAEEIGVRERDILVSINRQSVSSFDEVRKVASTLRPGDAVAFRVMRAAPAPQSRRTQWVGLYLSGTLPSE
ncbi:MAG: Do family serine endopeptidase [Bryobacteraceae bacterium]|nr:Do family serine endopeptidase [Bryobacteraceae bacterium]